MQKSRGGKHKKILKEEDEDFEMESIEKKRVRKQANDEEEEEFELDDDFKDEEMEESIEDEEEDLEERDIKPGKKRKSEKPLKKPREPKSKAPKEKKPKLPKEKKPKVEKEKKIKKEVYLLDPDYNLESAYFYQSLSESEWSQISCNLKQYFISDQSIIDFKAFLCKFTNLHKGEHNIKKLRQIIEKTYDVTTSNPSTFTQYKQLNDFILDEYYTCKPSVLECHFFPNKNNEIFVVNMIRTCKASLDIAIFTLTNDKITAAIDEAFKRGVRVRVIADDECSKMFGSDCMRLASFGIDLKTDNNSHFHMHHKFAVLDNSVVVTGSFNWTAQAVKFNQENILFYENKEIANQYTQEFEKLWIQFDNFKISKEEAIKSMEDEVVKRQEMNEKRKQEREKAKEEKAKLEK